MANMFKVIKAITTSKKEHCNAYKCNAPIAKEERAIWTQHIWCGKFISAIWHSTCFKQATQFAPQWDKLMAIKENRAALPSHPYNIATGKLK